MTKTVETASAGLFAPAVLEYGARFRTSKKQDTIGAHTQLAPRLAFLCLPLVQLQPPLDHHLPALGEVFPAAFALLAPDDDVHVAHLLDVVPRLVFEPLVDGQPQLTHGGAAGNVADLGISREIPNQ